MLVLAAPQSRAYIGRQLEKLLTNVVHLSCTVVYLENERFKCILPFDFQ